MGMFEVQVKLANPGEPSRSSEVSLLVDTGATLSWVPRELLQRLGVRTTTSLEFQFADGRITLRDVGAALFTLDGKTLAIPCAFAEPGEESVLGATALEALGFVVDPVEKKLIPRRLLALITYVQSSSGSSLREEFNRWAEAGRGEGMEQDHLPITLPVLEKMRLAPTGNVMGVGCGASWLSRPLAKLVPEGRVVGMDISDEMIRHARRSSVDFDNVMFVAGEVTQIPWQPNFFSHAISVESSYYWPDPAAGAKDIFRVLNEGGSVWILFTSYRHNPHCHKVGSLLALPTHLL